MGRAPVNIALCKYWGKQNKELNLPYTSSLSLALPYYTVTTISINENNDQVFLNDKEMPTNSEFRKRTIEFLNLFRSTSNMYFKVETQNDLPTASGFASSASGFAALVIALDDLFNWNLTSEQLSVLARLGSGSASRSIYPGFVYWKAGIKSDGTDSYAKALSIKQWDNLRVGLLVISEEKKDTSSRDVMQLAVNTIMD
ncbi:MAG: diphosphomevalonate decarboxylase [Rickettsia endosymbiont of Bryobia graminum]|nr:diphosphomevalonate decarboxylase [Rickettsia endosymbiont of Bryobia graminum]